MSATRTEHIVVPRYALIAAAALITLSVAGAAAARIFGVPSAIPHSTVVASMAVRFSDEADKSVVARDATTGRELARYARDTNGFLRATLRGLVGDRTRVTGSEQASVPFDIVGWADGRISLIDPVTKRDVELEAFGITNEAAFAALLPGRALQVSAADQPKGVELATLTPKTAP